MESASALDSKDHLVNPPSHLSPRPACLGPVHTEGFYDKEPDWMELMRVSLKKEKRPIPPSKGLWASMEGVQKSNLLLICFFTVFLFILLSISGSKGQNFLSEL